MNQRVSHKILGLMSGSSLDGLDLAFCQIDAEISPKELLVSNFKILEAKTFPYPDIWVSRLQNLSSQTAIVLAKTNVYYSHYLAQVVLNFIKNSNYEPDFISSHGHTIFHLPQNQLSLQIGDGATLAALTHYTVITDYRYHDVALLGKGTPLAPIADKLLYPGYDYYLNIGGIANISFKNSKGKILAYDLGPANQIFNRLASLVGLPFDKDGLLASQGKVRKNLLQKLQDISYFNKRGPKSLDNNWIKNEIWPLYKNSNLSVEDLSATAVEHLVIQIQNEFKRARHKSTILITGGGAYHKFLIDRIKMINPMLEVILPSPLHIEYKEAALMALMGLLRMYGKVNCLASVTGAKKDSIGGGIFLGGKPPL